MENPLAKPLKRCGSLFSMWALTAGPAFAASTTVSPASSISPTSSLIKTTLGLLVVLAVMAAVAWFAKRMMSGRSSMQSVARIVGGVSVGSRERVMVIEVADRWLVVGVAPGQVNAIANLQKGEGTEALVSAALAGDAHGDFFNTPASAVTVQSLAVKGQAFASWLKQSLNKSAPKPDGH